MQKGRLAVSLVAMAVVAAGVALAILWQNDTFRKRRDWVITTGFDGGTYAQLGDALATSLTKKVGGKFEHFLTHGSAGSSENLQRLAAGEAHFALVQSDVQLPPDVRLVATLYDEFVHVLSSRQRGALTFSNLKGLPSIALGPDGSGTRGVAELLLKHFAVDVDPAAIVDCPPSELETLFESGSLDAAFVLAAPGAPIVDRLIDRKLAYLVPIGNAANRSTDGGGANDAFAMLHPEFGARLLPTRVYGTSPQLPIPTVSVAAMLVTRASTPTALVRAVTAHLHENHHQLTLATGIPLSPGGRDDLSDAPVPFHQGAAAYHLREEPSFLVEYAEAISLILTVLVGLWSLGSLFVRWRNDLKKERIDAFYQEIRGLADLDASDRLGALRATHRRAFDDLMAERLAANESFTIFQNYLLSEIARAEHSLESRPRRALQPSQESPTEIAQLAPKGS